MVAKLSVVCTAYSWLATGFESFQKSASCSTDPYFSTFGMRVNSCLSLFTITDPVTHSIDRSPLFVSWKLMESVLLTHPGVNESLPVTVAVDDTEKSSTFGGRSCRHSGNLWALNAKHTERNATQQTNANVNMLFAGTCLAPSSLISCLWGRVRK